VSSTHIITQSEIPLLLSSAKCFLIIEVPYWFKQAIKWCNYGDGILYI